MFCFFAFRLFDFVDCLLLTMADVLNNLADAGNGGLRDATGDTREVIEELPFDMIAAAINIYIANNNRDATVDNVWIEFKRHAVDYRRLQGVNGAHYDNPVYEGIARVAINHIINNLGNNYTAADGTLNEIGQIDALYRNWMARRANGEMSEEDRQISPFAVLVMCTVYHLSDGVVGVGVEQVIVKLVSMTIAPILGVTFLKRFVPSWFLTANLGLDVINIGLAIEF